MTAPHSPAPPDQPFGTEQPRSGWPLIGLAALFVLWFAFLIVLAVRYPAR